MPKEYNLNEPTDISVETTLAEFREEVIAACKNLPNCIIQDIDKIEDNEFSFRLNGFDFSTKPFVDSVVHRTLFETIKEHFKSWSVSVYDNEGNEIPLSLNYIRTIGDVVLNCFLFVVESIFHDKQADDADYQDDKNLKTNN